MPFLLPQTSELPLTLSDLLSRLYIDDIDDDYIDDRLLTMPSLPLQMCELCLVSVFPPI